MQVQKIDWRNILSLSNRYREQEIYIYEKYYKDKRKRKEKNIKKIHMSLYIKKKKIHKKQLMKQYGLRCFYCNEIKEKKYLQREHIVPEGRGGSSKLSNVVLSCETCNQNKKDLFILHFAYMYLSITNIILLLHNLQQKIKQHWS